MALRQRRAGRGEREAEGPGANSAAEAAQRSGRHGAAHGGLESGQAESAASLLHSWLFVAAFLLPLRLLSALLNPIGDCDETFNYWEPTHFLMYGHGMQTWEYSPTYALRSYIYVGAHAVVGQLLRLLSVDALFAKYGLFYGIRVVFALASSYAEGKFVAAVAPKFGTATASTLMVALAFCPGMFTAATSYLPQTFTMVCLMLMMANWLRQRDGWAIFFMGVCALIGWPFIALAGIPMGLDVLRRRGLLSTVRWVVLSAAVCVAVPVALDYLYYKKLVFAALNIALYNSSSTHGANLYGIEPWTYYLKNLVLNFNVMLSLAAVGFLLGLAKSAVGSAASKADARSALLFASPAWVWLAVMWPMPHKEERFLYVVYPQLCLLASWGVNQLCPAKRPTLRRALLSLVFFSYLALSASRVVSQVSNYSAPLAVYERLYRAEASPQAAARQLPVNVCVGKEWYRFPSHFFFPDVRLANGQPKLRLQYLKSDFSGLLPKYFAESANATWIIPTEQNDMNREEPSRYVDVSVCDYIVDLDLPHQNEPHYARQPAFELLHSSPFLNAHASPPLARAFAIPFYSSTKNVYGEYQLLKRVRHGAV